MLQLYFLNMSGVPFEFACCFCVPFVCSVVSDHHHSGRLFDLCQGVVCFPPEARCDLFSGLPKTQSSPEDLVGTFVKVALDSWRFICNKSVMEV